MTKKVTAICMLFFVFISTTGCTSQKDIERAYQEGYAAAETAVYQQAYDEGFLAGSDDAKLYLEYEVEAAYDDGYKNGISNAPSNSDKWYEWGRQYGYEEGWNAAFISINEESKSYKYISEETKGAYLKSGYDEGYSVGYDDGFSEGYDQGYYDYEEELTEHAEEYNAYFDDQLSEAYDDGYWNGYYDGENNDE